MYRAVGRTMALISLAALLFTVASIGSCGGGGAGSGDAGGGSKLFVADSGHDAIGSVINTNPPPGNVIVDRVITGTSSNGMAGSTIPAILLDAAKDQLYVSTQISIVVFNNAGFANGPIDPSRRLTSAGGGYNSMSLDSANDYLYVGDSSVGVQVFHNASTANETFPLNMPSRTITSPSFGVNFAIRDVAFDAAKDILYVAVSTTSPFIGMSIFSFDDVSALNGSVAPDRTIPISTSNSGNMGLFVDSANDRLYFADSGGGVSIFEDASTRNDPATPEKSILLPSPVLRLAVDTVNDRLYAAGSTALYILPNVSTVPPGPVSATAALASSGGSFTAVAVRP
jgi:hypothetical protein